MAWILNKLLRTPMFTPLELQLLKEVESRLPADARPLFREQVNRINRIQRHDKGREVCCYVKKLGKLRRDLSARFPNKSLELKLVTLSFSLQGQPNLVTVKVYLVRGYFFSLVFSVPVDAVQSETSVTVLRFTLHDDPMKDVPESRDKPVARTPTGFHGWLQSWLERCPELTAYIPLVPEERRAAISKISATLPADYLELVAQSDGLIIGECAILGLKEVFEISHKSGDYHVLAQLNGDGVVAVKDNTSDGRVFFLDYEGQAVIEVAHLRAAIEPYLETATGAAT